MTDRYAVIGNPIAHSRSPAIHARFAAVTGEDMHYERLLAPVDGFGATVGRFRRAGGRGLNVTLPFKLDAFAYADDRSPRAQAAGAVNTLRFDDARTFGDNTDGIGLVRDIEGRLGVALAGRRVLLLGAGGAARGVVAPLLQAGIAGLAIGNRSADKAVALAAASADPRVGTVDWPRDSSADGDGGRFDVILDATSAGLRGDDLPLPAAWFAGCELAYELVYGTGPTCFLDRARKAGVRRLSDGLGMLVEQAAESFFVWRDVRPPTAEVYAALRAEVDAR